MRRREFIAFLTGATIVHPRAAVAQSSKIYRLGTINTGAPINEKSPFGVVLLRALEQRGYTLGKNLTFDAQGAVGQIDKLPELVRAMKADKVDVIVAIGFPT